MHYLCDRCKSDLHDEAYQRGLLARKPLFYRVMPTKSGFTDMWEINQSRIELCQKCTREFFKFVKPKGGKRGTSRK